MIDPATASALAILAAEWLKERRARGEADDDASFRSWLRVHAIPELIAQASQTLATVTSMKDGSEKDSRKTSIKTVGQVCRIPLCFRCSISRWRASWLHPPRTGTHISPLRVERSN